MNVEKILEKVKGFLEEIKAYHVELDPDPVAKGLSNLNVKISAAREYANRSAAILGQVTVLRRFITSKRDRTKSELEMMVSRLLSSDPRVYDAPEGQRSSVETRRANAYSILEDQGVTLEKELIDLDALVMDLTGAQDTIRLVYDNLNETRRDLLYQVSVIRTQIQIGEVHIDPDLKPLLVDTDTSSDTSTLNRNAGDVSF